MLFIKSGKMKKIYHKDFFELEFITNVQGKPCITSAANDGPDIKPILFSGTKSRINFI